jgi:hypothetical protein
MELKELLKEIEQLNNFRDEKYALHNAISESLKLEKQYKKPDRQLSENQGIFINELKSISISLVSVLLSELETQIEILDSKIRKLLVSEHK